PTVYWILKNHGKKVFLVGSELLFSYITDEIFKNELHILGADIVGIAYIPFKSTKVDDVIQQIIKQKPDIIFNTITGYSNVAFFNRLDVLTRGQSRPPVLSFRLTPADMNSIGQKKLIGDYSVWSYFINQNNPENTKFLHAYAKKYGSTVDINDAAVTAYSAV